MNKKNILVACIILSVSSADCYAAAKVLYDFEAKKDACWEVPEWCFEKKDYVCKTVETSDNVASHGKSSLKLAVDLPGSAWTAAVAECEEPVSLSSYNDITCDFYIPESAPGGIQAKLALTIEGDSGWKWIETVNPVDLVPGKWVTLKASLRSGSKDWMLPLTNATSGNEFDPKVSGATIIDMTDSVKGSVQKIDVRIESNAVRYKGDVFIDNITVSE